jgi:hypothetical protein
MRAAWSSGRGLGDQRAAPRLHRRSGPAGRGGSRPGRGFPSSDGGTDAFATAEDRDVAFASPNRTFTFGPPGLSAGASLRGRPAPSGRFFSSTDLAGVTTLGNGQFDLLDNVIRAIGNEAVEVGDTIAFTVLRGDAQWRSACYVDVQGTPQLGRPGVRRRRHHAHR